MSSIDNRPPVKHNIIIGTYDVHSFAVAFISDRSSNIFVLIAGLSHKLLCYAYTIHSTVLFIHDSPA